MIDRNDGAVLVSEYFDLGWVTEFRYTNTETFEDIQGILTVAWQVKKVFHSEQNIALIFRVLILVTPTLEIGFSVLSAKRMYTEPEFVNL